MFLLVVNVCIVHLGVTDQIVFYEPEMDRIQNYQVLDMEEDGTFYKLYEFVFKKDQGGKTYVSVDMVRQSFVQISVFSESIKICRM